MEKQSATTNATPRLVLEVQGELRVKGWDELQVVAKSDGENNLTFEQDGDQVRVSCRSNCSVQAPRDTRILVEAVYGNAQIKALDGEVTIRKMEGNLDLRGVGPTRVERVGGNLSARNIFGDLLVDSVDGNLLARDIQGRFAVDGAVHGNLQLKDVDGSALAQVDGNATLLLDPVPGQSYQFFADGNIVCRLPVDASVHLHIVRAARIKINLPDTKLELSRQKYDLTLGEGDARLELSAGGNLLVTGHTGDWDMLESFGPAFANLEVDLGSLGDEISQQVTQQIESQMEFIESQLEETLANISGSVRGAGLTEEQAERIAQRAREASQRATARVQAKMQRAQEKINRKMAEVQRKAEQKAKAAERRSQQRERRSWGTEATPMQPRASSISASDPISDEERLMILKMLEEKKITLEEAEQLLAALEGKDI